MYRKDRIYNALKDMCKNISKSDIERGFNGFTASEVADKVSVHRSNVCKDLNSLFVEKKLIKVKGKPVFFFDREKFISLYNLNDISTSKVLSTLKEYGKETKKENDINKNDDVFATLIGHDKSLKNAIEQAKAALLYPPSGLNTLLIGETGVGKSTFAELMFKFAFENGILKKDAEMIYFNCSEYADNPNMLLSMLFGHVKGAFTGANEEKVGLVEKADGGVLFLDEVHRLPPEGQEMLFLLMDKGKYRKMGETETLRKAKVFIICATTENINSVLLKTFIRRVPMVIQLPSLQERSLEEKLELIDYFLKTEAKILSIPVRVERYVFYSLLNYKCNMNIGQLKGEIQLLCAKGFLNYKTMKTDDILIDIHSLSKDLKESLLNIDDKRELLNDIFNNYFKSKDDYIVYNSISEENYNENALSYNLYTKIENNYANYAALGYAPEEINRFILRDINIYFKDIFAKTIFYKKINDDDIFKIVDRKIYEVVKRALEEASKRNTFFYTRRLIIALAMHIGALLENIKNGNAYRRDISYNSIDDDRILEIASFIYKFIIERLDVNIPKNEVYLIAMIIQSVSSQQSNRKIIPIIIICHGNSTATSLAEVANSLMGNNNCYGIDMPLTEKVSNTLNRTINLVKKVNEGKGVLLMVDMGSLMTFAEIITKQTGIPVKSIEMVSTPMVLEAARKSMLSDMTLDDLVLSLEKANPYLGRAHMEVNYEDTNSKTESLIIASCITGDSAAVKIAEMIKTSMPIIKEKNIEVLPMSRWRLDNDILDKDIIAVVGTVDLGLKNVPYIPIDEFILGDGMKRLTRLIAGNRVFSESDDESNVGIVVNILSDGLSFLNPVKAYKVLSESFKEIECFISKENYIKAKIGYILHCSYMIERCFRNDAFIYDESEDLVNNNQEIYAALKVSMNLVEQYFGIEIPEGELCYLIEYLNYIKGN
ncbi:sigma 54-interacting transcriptional regulator [Tepidanaerobacter sp. GT38]|uniref:sigma 54-interacting transcriptional regulator n=1 Tax=Tepidanaerobacter sp. GT38 TaxID=2722793 RepID=UPI001EFF65C0|nr:sigma-54-dependent transcriptional regulator [Tepidanaerobacter sp. GT38]MCG1013234.1 sigma 54-interacting transcriptional regulator [Tepidanaerobacter sp. GT38]